MYQPGAPPGYSCTPPGREAPAFSVGYEIPVAPDNAIPSGDTDSDRATTRAGEGLLCVWE